MPPYTYSQGHFVRWLGFNSTFFVSELCGIPEANHLAHVHENPTLSRNCVYNSICIFIPAVSGNQRSFFKHKSFGQDCSGALYSPLQLSIQMVSGLLI